MIPDISLIVPVYNEQEAIDLFFKSVTQVFLDTEINIEILFVNDGSSDNTLEKLKSLAINDERIKIITLSRNFGKEAALTAGLDFATGKTCVPIDCDLQDPPELILEMYKQWQAGFEVVLARRKQRSSDTFIKRISSSIFYKIIDKLSGTHIPDNVGDFRLMDKKVIEAIRQYPERSRFMKGLFASVGFKQITIEYTRPERSAGMTKWNYLNLYKLAIEGIVAYTSLPLKVWSYIGATISISAFLYGFYMIVKTIIFGIDVPGYASLMVVLLIMTGSILLSLGIIGEYLSRIYNEVKQRPIYLVQEKIGFKE